MHRTAIALAASLLLACFGPRAPDTKGFDLLDIADACAVACGTLHDLHCPEGAGSKGETCKVICTRSAQLRPLPLGCWSEAKSAEEARLCGSLRCLQP